ncbi:MAG: AMP-binding protein [Acidobacteriia bacterium]|nr:AMP-binding protein [Terriglobia bacterium]
MGKLKTQPETVTQGDLPLERIYRWERERASQVFLIQPYGGGKVRQWTWAEAVGESRRMAAYLTAQNWPPGSNVAILAKNCAWWILADIAIWMAGHVSVPIYASLKPESARQILEHSEAKACFLGATEEKEMAGALSAGILTISLPTATGQGTVSWDGIAARTTPLSESPPRSVSDLATIIYTSGTTGMPKGVRHTFGAFTYNGKALLKYIGLGPEQRVLSYLPLAHIVERMGVEMFSLYLGTAIYFTEGVERFVADLQRARPTIFLSVPRLLEKFQQNVFARIPERRLALLFRIPVVSGLVKRRILAALGLSSVQFAACGAAPLRPEVLRWYRNLGLNLAEGYGMTETLVTHLPAPGTVRPGWVGAAIPGVEARLGEHSELQIKSPMNLLGYYKNPQATEDAFLADGFFHTGDVCEIAPDGQLKIIGRLKEQFKTSKGKFVAPAPIEGKLAAHSEIEGCCVIGAGLSSPFAVVILSEEAQAHARDSAGRAGVEKSLAAILEETNRQLDHHERLAFIAVGDGAWNIANGFMTPTLKLKRALIEARYMPRAEDWEGRHRPVVWEGVE